MLSSIFKKFWRLELPNITGSISQGVQAGGTDRGSLYRDNTSTGVFYNNGTQQQALHFDASLSDAIYSKSTTVQPNSNQVLIIIKV